MNLANCHANGLDSLVISERASTERGMIRVFVARPDHELWRNAPGSGPMSIGLHEHHCDITMVPLFGRVSNVLPSEFGRTVRLDRYKYSSAIGGEGSFVLDEVNLAFTLRPVPLQGARFMRATEKHSVFVPKGESAAWVILEGCENPLYQSVMFSDADVEGMYLGGLYAPMTAERLAENLALLRENGVDLCLS